MILPLRPLEHWGELEVQKRVAEKRRLVEEMEGKEVAPRSYANGGGIGCGTKGWVAQDLKQREARFWSQIKISGSGCWDWSTGNPRRRYALFTLNGSSQLAHRVSWQLTFGEIINGAYVLHACDNDRCVRPDHLFLGTQKHNMEDMISKGRQSRVSGERVACSKMTTENVIKLREMAATGKYFDRELAAFFGIARSVVNKIRNGKLWAHVKSNSEQEALH